MIRTALTPKWLGLLAVVLVVVASFGLLGYWQLTVAQNSAHAEAMQKAEAKPVVPLTTVLPPRTALSPEDVGRTVTLSGEFVPTSEVLVGPRRLGDVRGSWLITGLRTADGAIVPVLRGLLPTGQPAPAPPSGVVQLKGMVAPGEPPAEKVSSDGRTLGSVDLAHLVNHWPGHLVNGFLFPNDEVPLVAAPPTNDRAYTSTMVLHVPPPDFGSSEVNWRNFAYALQWWCFAAFALYMWWRMVRADATPTSPPAATPTLEHA